MRLEKKKHFRCIRAASAEEFEDKVSEIYEEHPAAAVMFHQAMPFLAYVDWTEDVNVPETLADEFVLKGVKLFCCDCPHLEMKNDMRVRYHRCKYSTGPVRFDQPACDILYREEVKRGRIDG